MAIFQRPRCAGSSGIVITLDNRWLDSHAAPEGYEFLFEAMDMDQSVYVWSGLSGLRYRVQYRLHCLELAIGHWLTHHGFEHPLGYMFEWRKLRPRRSRSYR